MKRSRARMLPQDTDPVLGRYFTLQPLTPTSLTTWGSLWLLATLLLSGLLLTSTTSVPVAKAAGITVNSLLDNGDGPNCTLREAIQGANSNTAVGGCAAGSGDDIITFSVNGTISLATALDDIDGNLRIEGPGPNLLTVQRGAVGATPKFRIFNIFRPANSSINAYIGGMTIRNGREDIGGGISSVNAQLTVENVVMTENTALIDGGGAIYTEGATDNNRNTLVISNSLLVNNTATRAPSQNGDDDVLSARGHGGAIKNDKSDVIAHSVVISGNKGSRGGGWYKVSGLITMTKVTFENNETDGYRNRGGALFHGDNDGGVTRVIDSTFRNNRSLQDVGAEAGIAGSIFTQRGLIDIYGSTFVNNVSAADGGAIYKSSDAFMNITNSTFHSNQANGVGGAIFSQWDILNVVNSTFTSNTANTGGGIYFAFPEQTTAPIRHSIFADNAGGDIEGRFDSKGFNIVKNRGGSVAASYVASDLPNGTNPNLGPLQDNGGPTLTRVPNVGSPAIDTGDPAGCVRHVGNTTPATSGNPAGPLSADQRGFARPAGARCDIGAVEANAVPPTLTLDLNGPGTGVNYSASYQEQGPALAVVDSANLSVTGATIVSASVTLNGRLNGASEVLTATASGGVAVSYNSATGVLLLSGSASATSYQQVLRTVKYHNTAYFPDNTVRTLGFVVSDGTTTATATTTLDVLSPLVVMADSDSGNGASGAFGSLSLAIIRAGDAGRVVSKTISFSPAITEVVVTAGSLPPLTTGVGIQGRCTTGPDVTIRSNNLATAGLTLNGSNRLFGIKVKGFGDRQVVATGPAGGSELKCVRASKT